MGSWQNNRFEKCHGAHGKDDHDPLKGILPHVSCQSLAVNCSRVQGVLGSPRLWGWENCHGYLSRHLIRNYLHELIRKSMDMWIWGYMDILVFNESFMFCRNSSMFVDMLSMCCRIWEGYPTFDAGQREAKAGVLGEFSWGQAYKVSLGGMVT